MKIFKKLFYLAKFYIMYHHKIRKNNDCVNNFSGKIVLNPLNNDVEIPKIIWIYWEGELPIFVQSCIDNIKNNNQNYQLYVLNPNTIIQFSSVDFTRYPNITPQQKADLLRFDLMFNHGGIWLDASIIVYENLDWIQSLLRENKTDIFAYYRKRNTILPDYPVIENWLLASSGKNEFFKYWFEELEEALLISPQKYIAKIRLNEKNSKEIFQKIGNLEYLIAYVACQKVYRKYGVPSITLIDCDQNAFYYQVKNRWVKERILIDMAVNYVPKNNPKLIKLAGKERKYLCEYYSKNMYFKNSFMDF